MNRHYGLAHLQGREGQVHLLFTDVYMPGSALNGIELAQLVRAKWPKVALLITSTFYDPYTGKLPASGLFLSKPYGLAKLVHHAHHLTADCAPSSG